jgi:hypothetical protein
VPGRGQPGTPKRLVSKPIHRSLVYIASWDGELLIRHSGRECPSVTPGSPWARFKPLAAGGGGSREGAKRISGFAKGIYRLYADDLVGLAGNADVGAAKATTWLGARAIHATVGPATQSLWS